MTSKYGLTPVLSIGEGGRKVLWLVLSLFFALTTNIIAQEEDETYTDEDTASVITAPLYKENPAYYLRNIDSASIPTGILIDRVKFRNDMGLFNGKSKVKTGDFSEFWDIEHILQSAANVTVWFPNFDTLKYVANNQIRWQKIQPIAVMNYCYNKIKQKNLKEINNLIADSTYKTNYLPDSLFSTRRVFLSSPFNFRIHGDIVPFVFYPYNYFTNQLNDTVVKIEANFGNGWQTFEWNTPKKIHFNSNSSYIEVKVRFSIQNKFSGNIKKQIAHFTVLRTGSELVPNPSQINESLLKATAPNIEPTIFPKSKLVLKPIIFYDSYGNPQYSTISTWVDKTPAIEYTIIVGKNNLSNKLRKPLIICDGFDPGDKRDFTETTIDDPETLEKSKDTRGIYQLLNGDPSPWYKDSRFANYDPTEANLALSLKNADYDLIVVNFLDGAGDIGINAYYFRRFLMEIINGELRDNQTEENVIVGPSMGGLITRIALDSIEKYYKQEHLVREWFSFDSPQEGAYIPISLQYAIRYLYYILDKKDDGILTPFIHEKKLQAQNVVDNILNSLAAKQMLKYHYSSDWRLKDDETYTVYPYNTQDRATFVAKLDEIGYPKITRNIAITNGGTQLLYTDQSVNILNYNPAYMRLQVIGDRTITGSGNSFLFDGEYDGAGSDVRFNLDNYIGYEPSPGGWNSALYDLNCKKNNEDDERKTDTDTRYCWATFMNTSSALGVPITSTNVNYNWTDYQNNPTLRAQVPFDDIYGQTGMNEEHVRISTSTGKQVMDYLNIELNDIQRPRLINRSSLSQTVSGPLKLKGTNTVTLGGNSNFTYTLNSGADVNIAAGTKIVFKPGTKALKGAKLKAKTGSTAMQKSAIENTVAKTVSYPNVSPYSGKVASYSDDTETATEINPVLNSSKSISIYPNPSNGLLQINISSQNTANGLVTVTNMMGTKVYSAVLNSHNQQLDLRKLTEGLYLVTVNCNKHIYREKILIKK